MTNVVMKALALVETAETDNPNGAFDVILSAPTLDRDGEVIDSRAFDPLPDHIPFDIDHAMTVTGTVGSGTPYYDADGTLRVKGTFASTPLAQEVRTLVSEGHIRTTSVTFMAAKRVTDDKGVDHVQNAELLNGTFTPVPSNRESIVLSAKALNAVVQEKVGARNSASDAELIQQAHDAMMNLGAMCGGKSMAGKAADAKDADVEAASNPGQLAQGVDAAIDAAIDLFATADLTSLPAEVAQGITLIQAADATCDELLDALGVTDPDEDVQKSADIAAPAAASAAADAAKSADDGDLARARAEMWRNTVAFI